MLYLAQQHESFSDSHLPMMSLISIMNIRHKQNYFKTYLNHLECQLTLRKRATAHALQINAFRLKGTL